MSLINSQNIRDFKLMPDSIMPTIKKVEMRRTKNLSLCIFVRVHYKTNIFSCYLHSMNVTLPYTYVNRFQNKQ